MHLYKKLPIFVSEAEVVAEATPIELMRIIRDGLQKIKQEYISMHNLHCQSLKDFENGRRHPTKELIKYQENCIKTLLVSCAELEKTIEAFNNALKSLESYHRVRGFKGEFP